MRTSSYVIYVDLPNSTDEMLLVHGYSGAYDKVSRNVASWLRSLEVRRPPKPLYGAWVSDPVLDANPTPPSEETVRILRRRGYITDFTIEQEEQILGRISGALHERSMKMPTYIFMPTYDCNLRCSYCFQDHMRTNPKFNHLLRTMSPQIIDWIFKGIGQIEARHGFGENDALLSQRNVGFFGGEPLLAANRQAVEYIIEKTLELGKGVFWAVTNATELEAYRDLLNPDRISSLQITLDGPPAEHDQRRIYADGSGSFQAIARNISMALEQKVNVNVRLNVDRNNIGQLPELAEVMQSHGWDKSAYFSAYTAPIRAENEKTSRATTMDTWELDKMQAEVQQRFPVVRIIDRPDDKIKYQARRIFHDPGVVTNLRESFCSAHTGMYIFDAFADVYACWERTGDPNIRIGHINETGQLEINPLALQMWRTRTVTSNPVCRSCRYALYCGGGCAVLAAGRTGNYHTNFCDGFASLFRAGVAEAYIEHLSGAALTAKAGRVCDQ